MGVFFILIVAFTMPYRVMFNVVTIKISMSMSSSLGYEKKKNNCFCPEHLADSDSCVIMKVYMTELNMYFERNVICFR